MDNQLIFFLGDQNFPSKIFSGNSDHGKRIRMYGNLYRQYSRLEFTPWYDRPIAIAGLEKCLICNLNAQVGFGIFNNRRSLLQPSLLWRTGQEASALIPIKLLPDRALLAPSWSWMGYEGIIDYFDVPLREVEWELPDGEIRGPWCYCPESRDAWN
ncbi:hypothetical protein B7494_g4843 [Chlorociboria aeruginascens]|nr:hypothetical protein B7494_g4843 [Chlorociboria aeruginascens]